MQVFNTLDNASINIRGNHNGSVLTERQFVNDINQVLAKIPHGTSRIKSKKNTENSMIVHSLRSGVQPNGVVNA